MAPLTLEGHNLGEKHQNFNFKVNEYLKTKTPLEEVLEKCGNSDIDNLLKIDIAGEYRHVEFILQVLKSDDMLYVSRAIKKSTWIITDQQYSHIINPQYLYSELFPYMTSKAICKLLRHIRLHLKNEIRVEEFYKYFEEKDFKMAIKWLPNCSLNIIEQTVEKHHKEITVKLFKRLCEKSFSVFEKFVKAMPVYGINKQYFEAVFHFLGTHTKEFLDILERISNRFLWPKFGKRHTAMILKNCPERILNNFGKYATSVDIKTVAEYLGPEKIKDFILKLSNNVELQHWFSYKNVKPMIQVIPKEGKFEFLKKMFVNKEHRLEHSRPNVANLSLMVEGGFGAAKHRAKLQSFKAANVKSSSNVYDWYRHAPFEIAFPELKKLIKTESSPEERGAILRVMLTTAGRNMNHIQALLQYYHDKHISEPFKYKVNFINAVLTVSNTHMYDKETWQILDEIFHNMEVYTTTENSVDKCVEAIIVYKILNNQPLPSIIESKYDFKMFRMLKKKLNEEEQAKLFNFIYSKIECRLNNLSVVSNKDEFNESFKSVDVILDLLCNWNKDLKDYPLVLNTIKNLNKVNKEKNWAINLAMLYNRKKSWRKYMFEESLTLLQSEEVCLNVLKHNPTLLHRNKDIVEKLFLEDHVILSRMLSKLKIYWPDTLAKEYANFYCNSLSQPRGHRSLARGLCTLLTRDELCDLLKQYAPEDIKIVWSEVNEIQLNLQKNFARLMHCARPPLPPAIVLLYAKGSYLQYTLPSLISIFYNMSSSQSRQHIPLLLNGPVSLRKHGIRFAFLKLKAEELKNTFDEIWNNTKSASIRAVIFQQTFNLLCREMNTVKVYEIWKLLEVFIDNLSSEENKTIYALLGKVSAVPKAVQAMFLMKSYKLLKSLPPKANCENLADQVALQCSQNMDKIDPDFVAEIILDFIAVWLKSGKIIKNQHFGYPMNILDVVVAYAIIAFNEEEQQKRYDKVIKSLFVEVLALRNQDTEDYEPINSYFEHVIVKFVTFFRDNIKDVNCVIPVLIFEDIKNILESNCNIVKDYYIIRYFGFIVSYVQCCFKLKEELRTSPATDISNEPDKEDRVWSKVRPLFIKDCLSLLKEEIEKYFPSIQLLFRLALRKFHICAVKHPNEDVEFVQGLIEGHDYIPAYLIAIDLFKNYNLMHVARHMNVKEETKRKVIETRKMLAGHPSMEVQMHLYKRDY